MLFMILHDETLAKTSHNVDAMGKRDRRTEMRLQVNKVNEK